MARRRSGLCCETSEPIRRPFAQKLQNPADCRCCEAVGNLLFAHAVDDWSNSALTTSHHGQLTMQPSLIEGYSQLPLHVETHHTGERRSVGEI